MLLSFKKLLTTFISSFELKHEHDRLISIMSLKWENGQVKCGQYVTYFEGAKKKEQRKTVDLIRH